VAGTLVVQRPGRFRWEVRPASAAAGTDYTQLMVADGRNVWFYDRELEQVTVRAAAGALTATPAMLLSGTVDLRQAFELRSAPARAGLDWVVVRPRRSDAEFSEARLAFAGGELRRMELLDKLGQTAVIEFGRATRNGRVAPEELAFTPPPGADVIGKPAS
jgi:outer membrane lipoprotein carrier protein